MMDGVVNPERVLCDIMRNPTHRPAVCKTRWQHAGWEAGLKDRPESVVNVRLVMDLVLAVDAALLVGDRGFGVLSTGMRLLAVLCNRILSINLCAIGGLSRVCTPASFPGPGSTSLLKWV